MEYLNSSLIYKSDKYIVKSELEYWMGFIFLMKELFKINFFFFMLFI